MRFRRSTKSGFTLVELLVVIGIIALLISILLPSLSRAREQGNQIKCLSNLRQVGMAFQMYANQHKQKLPPRTASRGIGPMQWDWIYWQTLPAPGRNFAESLVVGNLGQDVLRCPSDDWQARVSGTDPGGYLYSYSVSGFIMNNTAITATGKYNRSLNLGVVKRSTQIILAVEEDERTLQDGIWVTTGSNITMPNDYLAIRHDGQRIRPDDSSNWDRNLQRRGKAVFLDGHGEYVPRSYAHTLEALDPGL
jgi:prepilin-type N-terminal cleavage/methylation domain-containing protein